MNKRKYAGMTMMIIGMVAVFMLVMMLEYIVNAVEKVEKPGVSLAVPSLDNASALRAAVVRPGTAVGQMTCLYLQHIKIPYTKAESLSALQDDAYDFVIDCGDGAGEAEEEALRALLQQGTDVMLMKLPSFGSLRQGQLASLLGIKKMNAPASQRKGIRFVDGFMVGGLADYLDMEYTAADVTLASGTETYSYAISKEEKARGAQNEALPPTAWRYQNGGGAVYVVNTDLIEKPDGVGILSGLLSARQPDFLYPALNAYMLCVFGMPTAEGFEEEAMRQLYSRSGTDVQSDVLLPTYENICRKYNVRPVLMQSGADTAALPAYTVDLFNNVVTRLDGELVLKETAPYSGDFGQMLSADIPALSSVTSDIYYTDPDVFSYRSLLTAYGLLLQNVDMRLVLYPQEEKYNWTAASLELETRMSLLRQNHTALASLTLEDMGPRVQTYLREQPEILYGENAILIRQGAKNTATQYILRTQKDVKNVAGGSAVRLEEGVWLVQMYGREIHIELQMPEQAHF